MRKVSSSFIQHSSLHTIKIVREVYCPKNGVHLQSGTNTNHLMQSGNILESRLVSTLPGLDSSPTC